MQRTCFFLLLLSLLSLSACGGSAFNPARPRLQQHQGTVSLSQMLAELDALQPPLGSNTAQFAELKQALRTYLENSGVRKFTAKAPAGATNAVDDLTPDLLFDDQGNEQDRVSWSYRNIGDYDQNSEVNVADLSALGAQLGKTTTSPDWENKAKYSDGDGNGEVNISDITPLGAHLLQQVSAYRLESGDSEDGPWTEVTTVDFVDSELMPSGQRMFTVPVTAPLANFYRVVPIDSSAAEGVPSLASQAFVLSDKAEIVGKPGGVQFVSLSDHTLVLEGPDSSPTTIAVGDIIVGNDDAGYLWRVLTVVQDGTTITVTGEDAPITDLIAKGVVNLSGLFAPITTSSLHAGAKVTSGPHELTIDCPHTDMVLGGYDLSLNSLHFKFDPDLELLLSVNGTADPDNPVLGFVCKLTTPMLEYYVDCALEDITFNGTFPTDPDDPDFRSKITTVPLDFNADVNGVPMKAKWNFDLWFGIAGSGNFDGTYQYDAHADYSNAKFGGWWNPLQNWTDWNEFTSSYSDPDVGTKPTVFSQSAGPCSVQYYLYGKLDAGLFSDPNRKAELTFKPTFEMALTPSGTPVDKDLYTINGFLDLGRDFQLGSYGLQNLDHNTPFSESQQLIDSGFVDRTVEPDEISGTVTEDTNGDGVGDSPLAGVIVYLYDNTDPGNPVEIDSALTPSDGKYSFTGVTHPLNVKLDVDGPGYSFNPLSIEFTYNGGYVPGNDFVGTATVSGDKSISGTITDGTNPIAGLLVGGSITGIPGTLWMDTTDANGNYTLNGISPGLNVTVTPDPNGTDPYDYNPLSRDYPNVQTDLTGADFTASLVTTWTHSFGFNPSQDEVISGVTSDASGNVYVCGYAIEPAPSADKMALVAKYSPTGTLLWSQEEGVSFIGEAYFTSIAVDASGVYTVGTYDNENTFNQEILVMKWDSGGNVVWKTSWGLGSTSAGWACALDTFGNLYVGGECSNGVTGQDPAILKYDSNGNLLWQKAYAVGGSDFVRGGYYDAGNFYLVGHATNTAPISSEDIALLKIFNDGSVSGDYLYDTGDLYNAGLSVITDGSFNTYIAGSTVAASGLTSQATLVKLGPTLLPDSATLWNVNGGSFNQFQSITRDGFGNLLTTGYWNDGSLMHGIVGKFDSSLSSLASEVFNGSGETRLYGAAISKGDGDLLLGGYAPDALGSWTSASVTTVPAIVTQSSYGGVIGDVVGTVNPSSPFTNDYFPNQDLANGGKDAFAIKRSKP